MDFTDSLKLKKFKEVDTYKVTFFNSATGETEEGWLTAPPQITFQSSWTSIAEFPARGSVADAVYQATRGRSFTVGFFTFQKWEGEEPLNITFELGYVAIKDAFTEVVKPVITISKWCLTEKFSLGTLKPPLNPITEEIRVVGKYFEIGELLPESATIDWGQSIARDGHPTSAKLSFVCKTKRAVDQLDVMMWFKVI